MDEAAHQGWNVFFDTTMRSPAVPRISLPRHLVAQLLCGLATVTSSSRMIFAFARDGGLPFSSAAPGHPSTARPCGDLDRRRARRAVHGVDAGLQHRGVGDGDLPVRVLRLPMALGFFALGQRLDEMGRGHGRGGVRARRRAVLPVDGLMYLGIQPPNDKALDHRRVPGRDRRRCGSASRRAASRARRSASSSSGLQQQIREAEKAIGETASCDVIMKPEEVRTAAQARASSRSATCRTSRSACSTSTASCAASTWTATSSSRRSTRASASATSCSAGIPTTSSTTT